jgi:hypothetical protein
MKNGRQRRPQKVRASRGGGRLFAEVQRQPDIVLGHRPRTGFGVDDVVKFGFLELLADFAVLGESGALSW